MVTENVGSLPGDRERAALVGMVTDRDLVIQVVATRARPRPPFASPTSTRRSPWSPRPDEPLDQALQRMAEEQVRRLPVVSDGELVGILAQGDVARSAEAESTGQMVEEISQK